MSFPDTTKKKTIAAPVLPTVQNPEAQRIQNALAALLEKQVHPNTMAPQNRQTMSGNGQGLTTQSVWDSMFTPPSQRAGLQSLGPTQVMSRSAAGIPTNGVTLPLEPKVHEQWHSPDVPAYAPDPGALHEQADKAFPWTPYVAPPTLQEQDATWPIDQTPHSLDVGAGVLPPTIAPPQPNMLDQAASAMFPLATAGAKMAGGAIGHAAQTPVGGAVANGLANVAFPFAAPLVRNAPQVGQAVQAGAQAALPALAPGVAQALSLYRYLYPQG